MKVGNYSIKWFYSDSRTITNCYIDEADTTKGFGCAVLHEGDNFCRETGRKLTLARALKSAELPKEERKVVWEAYRKTKPNGRW